MKAKEVPQEESVLEGNRRACYAEDEHGRYVVVPSKGWEVEKIVNAQAHAEIDKHVEEARQEVLRGEASPLKYHMLKCQMTPGLLSATAGLWRWQVRRHFKPEVFARLKRPMLERYADAMKMSVEELCKTPHNIQPENHVMPDETDKTL